MSYQTSSHERYAPRAGRAAQSDLFERAQTVNQTTRTDQANPTADTEPITLQQVLGHAWFLIRRLVVALQYQLFKRTGQTQVQWQRLPWFKLAVVAGLAFLFFKKEFSLSINMAQAESGIVLDRDEEQAPAHAAQMSLSGPAVPAAATPAPAAPAVRANPFLAAAGDTEKDRRYKAYVRRFGKVAQTEMDTYGIPASIKIAQGLLESDAGKSRLSRQNNNHFGIKCFSRTCAKGHCSNFSDDSHKDFFRKYTSAWDSYRAHSKLLVNGKYKELLAHGKDYVQWAKGLKRIGYATAAHYDQKLIDIIERYELTYLDEGLPVAL